MLRTCCVTFYTAAGASAAALVGAFSSRSASVNTGGFFFLKVPCLGVLGSPAPRGVIPDRGEAMLRGVKLLPRGEFEKE